MVVAETMNNKSVLKVSVSGSDSSSEEISEESDNDVAVNSVNADAESIVSSDTNTDGKEVLITNEGWADSLTKILASKKPKNKKTLVLSRAKKYAETLKSKQKEDKPQFEVIGEIKEEKAPLKTEIDITEPIVKKKKVEKASIRVKPNILEKDRERILSKIATKGVVQLFNAVRNQQKTLEKELDRGDLTETKKEKIMKKFDKRTFLDSLMGHTKSVVVDEATKITKNEVKNEDKPKWNALRDDFMMGAKMKDWDKETIEE